jgi:8-amino-7-oxononanoate synthase
MNCRPVETGVNGGTIYNSLTRNLNLGSSFDLRKAMPHPREKPVSTGDWLQDELDHLERKDLRRTRRRLQSSQGPRVRLRGRDYVNFASNDYLNLASDPRLAAAAARAARRYGTGAGASPLVTGLLPPLRALERDLARWEGCEAALVFASGFAANLAVVSSLAGPGDAVFSDELNHASLIDGCRLSRAEVHVYRHADVTHLAELLRREGARARRRIIATDSVFSMDGDLAPLVEVHALAETHDCLLVIDEAHATGVLGDRGRGLSDRLPRSNRIIKVGTLSKALGAQGGFVCGTAVQKEWLVNRARPYVFSTALAPPSAAAARKALAIADAEPQRREQVAALADLLRRELVRTGFPETCSQSAIVPVIVGAAATAVEWSGRLLEHGLLVPAIRPPSVPEGTSRLRVSLTAGHTAEDVGRLVEALHKCPS